MQPGTSPDVTEGMMERTGRTKGQIRFGIYTLDQNGGGLLKNGIRIRLAEQPLVILQKLLAKPGEVVTREELRQTLWPDGTFVEFEHGLNAAVNKLRQALGDSATVPRYIETIPKQGYRFIAPVEGGVDPVKPADRRWMWTAALVAVAAAGLAGWVAARNGSRLEPELRAVPLTSLSGCESFPSFSPDGGQVVFVWENESIRRSDLYVKTIGSESLFRLTEHPGRELAPAWSPDGRMIAFARVHPDRIEYLLKPPTGGPEKSLGTTSAGPSRPSAAWLPDSRHLVIADRTGPGKPGRLILIDTLTHNRTVLTEPDDSLTVGDRDPSVSPDGRSIAFIRSGNWALDDVFVLDLEEDFTAHGAPRRVTFDRGIKHSSNWISGGNEIVYLEGVSNGLRRISVNGGAARPIPIIGMQPIYPTATVREARVAYTGGDLGHTDIWRLDLYPATTSQEPSRFISSTLIDQMPQFSPDGKRIAFESERSGDRQIWVCDADGRNPIQLTVFPPASNAAAPRWSPDGLQIAFNASPEGHRDIYVAPAAGGSLTRLTADLAEDMPSGWSPDGEYLHFSSTRGGKGEAWKMPAGGGPAVRVSDANGAVPSPDGKFLYLVRGNAVWRRAIEGGEETLVIPAFQNNAWTIGPDGLYWIDPADEQGVSRIQFRDFSLGETRTISQTTLLLKWGLTVSPDGKTLLFAQKDPCQLDLMLVEGFR